MASKGPVSTLGGPYESEIGFGSKKSKFIFGLIMGSLGVGNRVLVEKIKVNFSTQKGLLMVPTRP